MQVKKLIFMVLLLTGFGTSPAQEIIATGGDYFSTVNGSMSSTIGETVVETFPGTATILTQGFQQCRLKVLGIYERPNSNLEISAYPNPVKDYVKIGVERFTNEHFSYQLFDFNGKKLAQEIFEGPETEISLLYLPSSVYFLRVYVNDTEVKAFKIVKQ